MNNINKRINSYLLVTLAIISPFMVNSVESKGAKAKKLTLKMGHCLDTGHPVHKAMVFMGERLEEKSDGRITLDIYPSSQLGEEKDLIEQLQMGILTLAKVSSSVLEQFIPEMKVYGLPYLFRDYEHKWKVLNGEVGNQVLEAGAKRRLIGLGYYEAGSRSFYTKDKPINTPDDLKGMKIRVQRSPIAIDLLKVLGASPTPIDWGELYTALQQGIVDGAENNSPSIVSARHYEVCKYYSLDEHAAPMDVVLVSKRKWDTFSEEDKRIIKEAFDESVEYQKKLWEEMEEECMKILTEAGMKINVPDKEPFIEKVQPMYDDIKKDELLWPLVEEVREVK
jgi:tripartite ATP-independent transporter DctP family solute receptor